MTAKELKVVNFDEMAMTPEIIQNHVNIIQKVMKQVMKDGEHYGKIPGCGDKPTLLKPGAEKLSTTFRLAPTYQITRTELDGGHREYEIICTLKHIPTDKVVGEGVGLCTSMESKYRWRNAERKCPDCGKEAIIKGQEKYGGGWICWKKKEGCGAKFKEGNPLIETQNAGRVENPDIADTFNTILKIGKKRAHVDAVLTATAASDIFTQDIEDITPQNRNEEKVQPTGKVVKTDPETRRTTGVKPKLNTATQPQEPEQNPTDVTDTHEEDPKGVQEIKQLLKEGYPSEHQFVGFLVSKTWIQDGQGLDDLTDNQIERLYSNYKKIGTLYNKWKGEKK